MNGRTLLRWSGYAAIAVVFAIACLLLSQWQFARMAERDAELAVVEANYDREPVTLNEVLAPGGDFDPDDEWTPVLLRGEYLADQQLLVRNRPHGGTSAFEVLVPFRTDDGRIVIVDRGWVRPGADSPEPDAVPAPPAGEVTVVARLLPEEPAPRAGRTAPEGQVPTINLDLVADRLSLDGEFVDSAYALMASEDPAPAERPAALASPSDDPGPHLSYAIQWILFAVMGGVFVGYMIVTERRHRREDAEEASQRAARAARRRDRDMQDEDDLLDVR